MATDLQMTYRARPDGSVDTAHYTGCGRLERSRAAHEGLSAIGRGLRRLFALPFRQPLARRTFPAR